MNRGCFRKGHDPRRHLLTAEERSRGGFHTFLRFMVEFRRQSGLAVPESLVEYLDLLESAKKAYGRRRR